MNSVANFLTRFGLPVVAIGLLVFAISHVAAVQQVNTNQTPVRMSDPPDNPFAMSVAAAGIVEPQTENISIGSPLPGLVDEVRVRVGQRVQRGDVLFKLDDRLLKAELASRQANLLAARAELTRLDSQPREEELPVSQARVAEAEARLLDEKDQLQRARELAAKQVLTAEQLNRREQATRMAEAQLAQVQAAYDLLRSGAWKYDKLVAHAAVEQAQAQVAQIETELDRLLVRAQVGSQVLQVNVRPGEFVGAPAGQALVVLGDVDQLHVRVDIDEYDIPRFRAGADARAMVRGRPQVVYPLRFVRVEPYVIPKRSLTGDNMERVDTRVLQVIYAVAEMPEPLFVGQQLDVFIDGSQVAAPQAQLPQAQSP